MRPNPCSPAFSELLLYFIFFLPRTNPLPAVLHPLFSPALPLSSPSLDQLNPGGARPEWQAPFSGVLGVTAGERPVWKSVAPTMPPTPLLLPYATKAAENGRGSSWAVAASSSPLVSFSPRLVSLDVPITAPSRGKQVVAVFKCQSVMWLRVVVTSLAPRVRNQLSVKPHERCSFCWWPLSSCRFLVGCCCDLKH